MGNFGILGGAAGKSGASYGLKMNLEKIKADPFICPSQIFWAVTTMSRQPKQNIWLRLKQKCLKGSFPYEQAFRCYDSAGLLLYAGTSIVHPSFCSHCYHQTHNCVTFIFIIVSNFDLIRNRENPMERWFPFSILFVKVIRGVCLEDNNSCTVYLVLLTQASTWFLLIICVLRGSPLNCFCADIRHTW